MVSAGGLNGSIQGKCLKQHLAVGESRMGGVTIKHLDKPPGDAGQPRAAANSPPTALGTPAHSCFLPYAPPAPHSLGCGQKLGV